MILSWKNHREWLFNASGPFLGEGYLLFDRLMKGALFGEVAGFLLSGM